MPRVSAILLSCVLGVVICCASPLLTLAQEPTSSSAEDDPFADQIIDTEPVDPATRLTGEAAAAAFQVDEGFSVTLFAGEPAVRQPIAMASDRHGRLWVVENYTYAEAQVNFATDLRDRVIVLEDSDRDGKADRRTVFWDQGTRITSVEVGRGGVWLLAAPALLFIPDADEDLIPDGEPVVLLDGWDIGPVRHNIVNGLRWGPDGWLYGRHGILATSLVGIPGTPTESRTPINCGIWRYHIESRRFEVVSTGTTNPWGMDWTADGELLFINTVIGHLWHALPNSHLERMYGNDFDPHLYSLMPQIADHIHWNEAERWSDIRNGISGQTDRAGGGHAHCGMLIYQEGRWPASYEGNVLAINLHGQRVNRDLLQTSGISYLASHGPDTFQAKDPWFRGVELIAGPDGQVWVADWSDTGECHENDGVSRSSGRIYQWQYNQSSSEARPNWSDSLENLIEQTITARSWWSRQSLLRLAHLSASSSEEMRAAAQAFALERLTRENESSNEASVRRARAMWAANAIAPIPASTLVSLLTHEDAVVRRWAVRLLSDAEISEANIVDALVACAEREENGLVAAHLSSALARMNSRDRLRLAKVLASRPAERLAGRAAQMIWYGINHAVVDQIDEALELAEMTESDELKTWIYRRLSSEVAAQPEIAEKLFATVAPESNNAIHLVLGMRDGTLGLSQLTPPTNWSAWEAAFKENEHAKNKAVYLASTQLRALFGDGKSVDTLKQLATSEAVDLAVRSQALESLGKMRTDETTDFLIGRIVDRDSGAAAVSALRFSERADVAEAIIDRWNSMRPEARVAALATLTARASSAEKLLLAVEQGKVGAAEVGPYDWRQIAAFESESLEQKVAELWPQAQLVFDDRQSRQRLADRVSESLLASGDASRGQMVFQKVCANCHRMLGEGARIGPDLTGSQRSNLSYLIDNIAAPSNEVATSFRTSLVQLVDGQLIVGVIVKQLPDRIELQTKDALQAIDVRDIELIKESGRSLMPDGLADALSDQELADLFRFLREAGQ